MIPARAVLYLMSFSGFLVSFMMRTDINLAMVAMAKMRLRPENSTNSTELYCYTSVTNRTQEVEDQKPTVKYNLQLCLSIYTLKLGWYTNMRIYILKLLEF